MQKTAKTIDFCVMAEVKDAYHYRLLTKHQFKTLKGQVLAGNGNAALAGLRKIINRGNFSNGRN